MTSLFFFRIELLVQFNHMLKHMQEIPARFLRNFPILQTEILDHIRFHAAAAQAARSSTQNAFLRLLECLCKKPWNIVINFMKS